MKTAVGIALWRDETTMRLNTDGKRVRGVPVMTREIRVYNEDGHQFDPASTIAHLKRKTGLGLLGGLNLDTSYLPVMCAVDGAWKFIFITIDNDASNLTCAKYISGELLAFPTLIVVTCPCLSHLVSNAVLSIGYLGVAYK